MTGYSYLYEGAGYSLDEKYGGFLGYRVPTGQIGTSLRPDTAAQIVEATNILNQGFKQVEVGAINTDIFDQIPKQHFKEIGNLMKITGAKASVHAPIQDIEPSGIIEGRYSELNREIVERKLKDVIDKAHDINPKESMPVTIRSANMAGTEFVPGNVEEGEVRFKERQIVAINQETGEVRNIFKEEERYMPQYVGSEEFEKQGEKPLIFSPRERLETANDSQWISRINELGMIKKSTDELLANVLPSITNISTLQREGQKMKLNPDIKNQAKKADIFLQNAATSFTSMFDEAYKYSDDETRKELKEIAKKYTNEIGDFNARMLSNGYAEIKNTPHGRKIEVKEDKEAVYIAENLAMKKNLFDEIIVKVGKISSSPQVLKPVEEFAIDKSAETFANVALHAYNKYGDNAPIVSIENLYTGMAYSKPEEFKKLIEKSRETFVKKAIEEGMGSDKAKQISKQLIGVTWDVGHLNMLRKQGFTEEDLVKATKLIAKDVKHVHITDNFGYGDSHLAPGMGNVPIKKHLEQLEKAGVLGNVKMINEIAGFVNQFKSSPFPYILEAFGSPIYGAGAPYWNQGVMRMGNYFSGYGTMLPEQHFSTYGAGFSGMPTELGGQIPGKSSRFSGTPNA